MVELWDAGVLSEEEFETKHREVMAKKKRRHEATAHTAAGEVGTMTVANERSVCGFSEDPGTRDVLALCGGMAPG